jgi:formylglycine-generating enzyme required for sulfatase activity
MQSSASAAASMPSQPNGFSSKSILPFHSIQTRFSSNSSAMKQLELPLSILKSIYLLIFFTLATLVAKAQVSSYSFTQYFGNYTPITGGTVLATGTGSYDDNMYTISALPFAFNFNGASYTSIIVSSNGFITFGGTIPAASIYTPISNGTAYSGAVSAWGTDANSMNNINGRTSEIRWEIVGLIGSRELVIQWKDTRPTYTSSATNAPYINYQIRIRETTSIIDIVYGPSGMAAGTTNSNSAVEIGLRGSSNADFKNRTNTTTTFFNSSSAGAANNATQVYSSITEVPGKPIEGLTYGFAPMGVPYTMVTGGYVYGNPNIVCVGGSSELVFQGPINGSIEYTQNGNFESINLDSTGVATLLVNNIQDDQIITLNNSISSTGIITSIGITQTVLQVNGYCSINNPNLTDFMLVQNVTTTGNNALNKTIQIQFDLSWGNSWRDNINWDAAWIFAKYKGSDGLWRHAKLNNSGFTINPLKTIEVTDDKLGAFIYSAYKGQGTFEAPETQIQWNYGLDGLTSVTGLEVRVFAVEMVYVPQGDFNVAKRFNVGNLFTAPGDNFPVVNTRLTPSLTYNDGTAATIRIKGDAGIDSNNDGTVDKPDYPTGYRPFYCYKYELTEQQYADFLNCLSPSQQATMGIAGLGVTLSNGEYFSSAPNRACGNMTTQRMLAYADWSGMRPMTILEMNKASYGPYQTPQFSTSLSYFPAGGSTASSTFYNNNNSTFGPLRDVGSYDSGTTTRSQSGSSYYGIDDLTGNAREHVVSLNFLNFNSFNGDGVLDASGNADVNGWSNTGMLVVYEQFSANYSTQYFGIRYVRSAE